MLEAVDALTLNADCEEHDADELPAAVYPAFATQQQPAMLPAGLCRFAPHSLHAADPIVALYWFMQAVTGAVPSAPVYPAFATQLLAVTLPFGLCRCAPHWSHAAEPMDSL